MMAQRLNTVVSTGTCGDTEILVQSRDGWDGKYDTIRYFNVRSKADLSQLNLPHGNNN